jgi:hypothetical protein
VDLNPLDETFDIAPVPALRYGAHHESLSSLGATTENVQANNEHTPKDSCQPTTTTPLSIKEEMQESALDRPGSGIAQELDTTNQEYTETKEDIELIMAQIEDDESDDDKLSEELVAAKRLIKARRGERDEALDYLIAHRAEDLKRYLKKRKL